MTTEHTATASQQSQSRQEMGLTINMATKIFQSAEGSEVRAIDQASLEIRPGEFFVMLGPSGCGKTTLLRAIAGLETLDAGEIYLGSTRIDGIPPYSRPVNTVFQSYALFPHLTVAENVAFGLEMEGQSRSDIRKRVQEMLDLVHLGNRGTRKPDQLSGGQQQRVALARALAKSPKVLLLDESLSALDFKLRRQMQVELKRIQRETGITFVFVTHDQEEALSMGDHIAVFSKGRPEQIGTPEEIYNKPVNRFVADFIGDINFIEASKAANNAVTISTTELPVEQDLSKIPVGSSLTLAVRPENISLGPAVESALCGTIASQTFMGANMRCEIQLDGGATILVRVPPPFDFDILHEHGQVSLSILPQHLRAVDQ
ncbi:MAG: ABC transporter ATP-binding protein [Bifidobacterium sp.]|uniref:Spermidine/putrescine import ATP-binding protein PotA n=1 Tax=Bifidobacterium fermentum TaxID=3059035 RepID=A0AB39UJE9_9BIFI